MGERSTIARRDLTHIRSGYIAPRGAHRTGPAIRAARIDPDRPFAWKRPSARRHRELDGRPSTLDTRRIAPEELRAALQAWFAARKPSAVEFRENLQPEPDDGNLYTVCYEAYFEPHALDQAYLEVWV